MHHVMRPSLPPEGLPSTTVLLADNLVETWNLALTNGLRSFVHLGCGLSWIMLHVM